MSFSNLSVEITNSLTKEAKKNHGIFFTPPEVIKKNVDFLNIMGFLKTDTIVLEPSCGSCEYISEIKRYKPQSIKAIEFNKIIYDKIKHFEGEIDNMSIDNIDFLNYTPVQAPTLIIGNPPYFVMKKADVSRDYYKYFNGRPNIFILFIIKSLKILAADGILSFILPKNFLNCSYYNATREYIYNAFKIIDITECENGTYLDTQQPTIRFIVQKTKYNNEAYVIKKLLPKFTIFNTKSNILELNKLYENSKSLYGLGFKVSVGNVVWNQCKNILTNDTSKTRLIYSADIKNNTLIIANFKNPEKKNYINKPGMNDMLLITNRGYGNGKYTFNCCIVDISESYLLENHVISVKYTKEIEKQELKTKYKTIIDSFNNKNTKKFIDLYIGNSALNTTELGHILPIYNCN